LPQALKERKTTMKSVIIAATLVFSTAPAFAADVYCGGVVTGGNDGSGILQRPMLCSAGGWCWAARSPEEAALCAAPAAPPVTAPPVAPAPKASLNQTNTAVRQWEREFQQEEKRVARKGGGSQEHWRKYAKAHPFPGSPFVQPGEEG
jgi:hypothetical protein